MEWIGQVFSGPGLILLVLSALMAAALVYMIVRSARQDRWFAESMDGVMRAVDEHLKDAMNDQRAQAGERSEELSSSLRGVGDSVTRVMADMARAQQRQMDEFSAQLRDAGRISEDRMAELRQSVEQRLGGYESRMDRIGDVLDEKLSRNEQRMERVRETMETQMQRMQADNGRRLDEMRGVMDEQLNAALDRRLGDSFRQVSERLDQVYEGLGEMQSLASGVGDLKRVLTTVRTRGLLGEIQLGALLSQLMSEGQYEAGKRIRKTGQLVDFAVKLPAREGEKPVWLPIDARFPQETYQRLLDAFDGGSQTVIDQLRDHLRDELIERAALIRDNFISPPETTAFAVMFLPIEGLYAEALHRPGLSEQLQRDYGVTLTGPATLTALLNSLQMGFRTLALEQRSSEVWALLGAVRGEFKEFAGALARTQKRIRQASESIEDAARKSRTIEKRLGKMKKLDGGAAGLLEEGDGDDDGDYDNPDWN